MHSQILNLSESSITNIVMSWERIRYLLTPKMPMEWNGYSWMAGGEGTQQSFLRGASPLPQNPALTLLYTFFDRKGTSFVYLPSKIGTPLTNLLVMRINRWNRKSSWQVFVAFIKLIIDLSAACCSHMARLFDTSTREFRRPLIFLKPEKLPALPSLLLDVLLFSLFRNVNDWINIIKIFQGVLLEIFTPYIVTYCIVL